MAIPVVRLFVTLVDCVETVLPVVSNSSIVGFKQFLPHVIMSSYILHHRNRLTMHVTGDSTALIEVNTALLK